MSLPHVILTVLSTRNATGYDITKEFSYSIGYFWNASHQQVYRELNKMAINGLVTCVLEPQEGKPDRKIYSITEEGRKALAEWFEQPVPKPTIRDSFSAKLVACAVQPNDLFAEQVAELIAESKTLLNHYKKLEQDNYSDPAQLDKAARLERLTLKRNIVLKEAWIGWA